MIAIQKNKQNSNVGARGIVPTGKRSNMGRAQFIVPLHLNHSFLRDTQYKI